MSTIIDTLAYNTYIASYNANMLSNEVFIDSATLRENIVSLARNIGYVPTSRRSSTATVSFEVDVSGLETFEDTIKIADVTFAEGVEVLTSEDMSIAGVQPPRVLEEVVSETDEELAEGEEGETSEEGEEGVVDEAEVSEET